MTRTSLWGLKPKRRPRSSDSSTGQRPFARFTCWFSYSRTHLRLLCSKQACPYLPEPHPVFSSNSNFNVHPETKTIPKGGKNIYASLQVLRLQTTVKTHCLNLVVCFVSFSSPSGNTPLTKTQNFAVYEKPDASFKQ